MLLSTVSHSFSGPAPSSSFSCGLLSNNTYKNPIEMSHSVSLSNPAFCQFLKFACFVGELWSTIFTANNKSMMLIKDISS